MFQNKFIELLLLGITLNITVCSLSCNPLLMSYILSSKKNFSKNLNEAIIFSATRAIVHILIATALFLMGKIFLKTLTEHRFILNILGGAFVATVGLFVFFNKHKSFSFFKTEAADIFALGIVAGLTPCLPHMAVWGYIIMEADSLFSAVVMASCFGLGEFLVPLILGALAGKISPLIPDKIFRYVAKVSGGILILIGIGIIFR